MRLHGQWISLGSLVDCLLPLLARETNVDWWEWRVLRPRGHKLVQNMTPSMAQFFELCFRLTCTLPFMEASHQQEAVPMTAEKQVIVAIWKIGTP